MTGAPIAVMPMGMGRLSPIISIKPATVTGPAARNPIQTNNAVTTVRNTAPRTRNHQFSRDIGGVASALVFPTRIRDSTRKTANAVTVTVATFGMSLARRP